MGFFDKLFGSDASFLGFMDFTGELDDEPQEEVEVTFTIEFEDTSTTKSQKENQNKKVLDFWLLTVLPPSNKLVLFPPRGP